MKSNTHDGRYTLNMIFISFTGGVVDGKLAHELIRLSSPRSSPSHKSATRYSGRGPCRQAGHEQSQEQHLRQGLILVDKITANRVGTIIQVDSIYETQCDLY